MNTEIIKIDGKRYEVAFEYDGDHLNVEDDYDIHDVFLHKGGYKYLVKPLGYEFVSDIISVLEEKRIGSIEETKAVKSVYWEK